MKGDRRAEAQLDKGMSQTKVKFRMYASKLLTERSPVVKRVMVAEANTDAPKSFCDAPGGTGHRDMARPESSARELGRPVPAQAGGQESDGAVVAVKRVMTAERRAPACMAFQTGTAERGWLIRPTTRKGEYHAPKKRVVVWCDAPRSSLEETRGESRCGCAGAHPWNHRRPSPDGRPSLRGNARTAAELRQASGNLCRVRHVKLAES